MRKLLLLLPFICTNIFALTTGSSLNISPISVFVNQPMGASLAVWNYNYSSGGSLIVQDIIPQTWVTVGGSSAVPVGWDKPAMGPGQPTTISPGSSVIFRYSAVFFAPSISPAYAQYYDQGASGTSLVAAGTQTYSVGALVRTNNGEINASNSKTVTVLPIALPPSQRGFGGN
jgi:hypothetical protein